MRRTSIALSIAAAAGAAHAQEAWFSGIGQLPGFEHGSFASVASPDGRYIAGVGRLDDQVEESTAIFWSQGRGLEDFGAALLDGGYRYVTPDGVAAQGTAVVGQAMRDDDSGLDAFLWTPGNGFQILGYLYPEHPSAWARGMSDDARAITGSAAVPGNRRRAWVWTPENGMQDLGTLPGGTVSDTYEMTPDGRMAVGGADSANGYEAIYWTEATGLVPLGDLEAGEFGSGALDVSADGSTIVGWGTVEDWRVEGVRWVDGGPPQSLGDPLQQGWHTFAMATSINGDHIVGAMQSQDATASIAVLWTPSDGWREISDVLASDYGLGAALAGWDIQGCFAVTDDGRTICGWGFNPDGLEEGWVAHLGEPCAGDFNEDGDVNTLDVLSFLNAWTAGCP